MSGGASAQSSSPVDAGQRVEIPAVGIAVTFPQDWSVDVLVPEELELTTGPFGVDYILEASWTGGGFCSLQRVGDANRADFLDQFIPGLLGVPAGEPGHYETTLVDLPIGEATRVDIVDAATMGPETTLWYARVPDGYLQLSCGRKPEPPADHWLSIAETLEYLPGTAATTEAVGETDGPIVLGGRIEVPSAGFALEVPEDWYAFDLTHPEIEERMAAFDETTALLATLFDPSSWWSNGSGQALLAIVLVSDRNENCNVTVSQWPGSLEELASRLQEALEAQIPGFNGEPVSVVNLPAGRAARLDAVVDDRGSRLARVQWWFVRDGTDYGLICTGDETAGGEWPSIAETFEFLDTEQ